MLAAALPARTGLVVRWAGAAPSSVTSWKLLLRLASIEPSNSAPTGVTGGTTAGAGPGAAAVVAGAPGVRSGAVTVGAGAEASVVPPTWLTGAQGKLRRTHLRRV